MRTNMTGGAGIFLDDCKDGITNGGLFPAQAFPQATPPTGWSPQSPPLIQVELQILSCQRISVGPFERGPVHLLFETHDNFSPPDSCAKAAGGDYYSALALTQFWIDDAEIAGYLRTKFGLPAQEATFNQSSTVVNGEGRQHWDFGLKGGGVSSLDNNVGPADLSWAPTFRFFYASADHEDFFDLAYDEHYSQQGLVSFGTIVPPLMFAGNAVGAWAATGGVTASGTYAGTFHQFRDMNCMDSL
jgi:hypothetical protein